MLILPDFGTKQELEAAVANGETVRLCDSIIRYAYDGIYCYTGVGWYATLTIKDGRVVKVA